MQSTDIFLFAQIFSWNCRSEVKIKEWKEKLGCKSGFKYRISRSLRIFRGIQNIQAPSSKPPFLESLKTVNPVWPIYYFFCKAKSGEPLQTVLPKYSTCCHLSGFMVEFQYPIKPIATFYFKPGPLDDKRFNMQHVVYNYLLSIDSHVKSPI